MMAYDSQFVLAILHKGSPVREIDRTVHLPFDSEYKIRLKNKHSYLRAKARVWVDGRQVSSLGDFILHPNETLDLERFLDESMTNGRRFKFVPLHDRRVNDPTDEENGIIKVEFYREKPWNPPIKPLSIRRTEKFAPEFDSAWKCNPTYTSHCFNPGGSTSSCSVNYVSNSIAPAVDSFVDSGAGATVEGGLSGQSFVYGSDFQTEYYPVTLELRIRGIERGRWEDEFEIDRPPRKKKRMIKFCPNCGAKRHRLSDKFCHRCGTAYHPRYERERGSIVR